MNKGTFRELLEAGGIVGYAVIHAREKSGSAGEIMAMQRERVGPEEFRNWTFSGRWIFFIDLRR